MSWFVRLSKRARKQRDDLPEPVKVKLSILIQEIEIVGPVRGNWKNYIKLGPGKHHCHLKSGRPTYVVCWEEVKNTINIVEISYVGTHEKAPY